MSSADVVYMGLVASLGCVICRRNGWGASPAEVHHVRTGTGAGSRAADTLTIPLCPEHHRGATGLHGLGSRGFAHRYSVTELDLVAETVRDAFAATLGL